MENKELNSERLYVTISYNIKNECSVDSIITNGFKGYLWTGSEEIYASLKLVDIPDGLLLPGQTKNVIAYVINVDLCKQLLASGDCQWGDVGCSLGAITNAH